jgi:uncharacterized protein YdaT
MQEVLNFNATLKGNITNVRFVDDSSNKTGQTVVDVLLMGGYTELRKVPLTTSKTNSDNGEEWTPEVGDVVLVQFINGNYADPVVTGFMPVPDNTIQSNASEAPRYHRRRNQTDLVIEKDGTERKYIKKDKITVIEGHEQVTVNSGDITIDVVQGKCTVHVKGKTAWTSEATIELDGTAGTGVKGIVQGDCICPFIRKPHIHISASVKGSK